MYFIKNASPIFLLLGVLLVYCVSASEHGEEPVVTVTPSTGPYLYGSNISLTCTVDSDNITSFNWNSSVISELELPMDTLLNDTASLLVLTDITLNNTGLYTCIVEDDNGTLFTSSIRIEVYVPVPNVTISDNQTVLYQGTVSINCTIYSLTPPTVMWSASNGSSISQPGLMTTGMSTYSSVLTISGANVGYGGLYTCAATNIGGMANSSSLLTVNVPLPTVNIVEPTFTTFAYGGSLTFRCTVISVTRPTVTWTTPTNSTPTALMNTSTNTYVSTIEIPAVTLAHTGQYICEGANEGGMTNDSTNMIIFIPRPLGTINPESSANVIYSSTITITCRIVSSVPLTSALWSHNGTMIYNGTDSVMTIESGVYTSTLRVPNAMLNNSGTYECRATTLGGLVHLSTVINVVVPLPTVDIMGPSITDIPYNSSLTLNCTFISLTRPTVMWTTPASVTTLPLMNTDNDTYLSIIEVSSVTLAHSGQYICKGANQGGMTSDSTNITVFIPVPLGTINPESSASVNYSSTITITCTVESLVPLTSVIWSHNGTMIYNGTDSVMAIRSGVYTSTLLVPNARLSNSGTYQCRATNEAGFVNISTVINIFVPPPIILSLVSISETIGLNVTLNCTATGFGLTYKWELPYIPSNENLVYGENTPILTIANLTRARSGMFNCTVTDLIGNTVEGSSTVTPLGPELVYFNMTNATRIIVVEGGYYHLRCVYRNRPDALQNLTILWFRTGVIVNNSTSEFIKVETSQEDSNREVTSMLYFVPARRVDFADHVQAQYIEAYTCNAYIEPYLRDQTFSHRLDMQIYFVPFFHPQPISVNRVRKGSTFQIKCSYDSNPIGFVTVTKINPNGPNEVVFPTNRFTAVTFNNIDYDKAGVYECFLNNTIGTNSTNVTIIVEDVPNQVTEVSARIVSFFAVVVSWSNVSSNFGRNQQYRLTYSDTSLGGETQLLPQTGLSRRLTDELQTERQYSVKVASCNEVGCGMYSENITFETITAENVSLQQVLIPTVLTTDSSIFISWSLPPLATPLNERQAIVRSYIIQYKPLRSASTPQTMMAANRSVNTTIQGLNPSTEYTVIVNVDYQEPDIKGVPLTFNVQTKGTGNIPSVATDTSSDLNTSSPFITVNWKPLTVEEGSQYLQHYVVRVQITDRSRGVSSRAKRQAPQRTEEYNISSNANSYNFTGVTPFSTFVIDVRANLLVDGQVQQVPITSPTTVESPETLSSAPINFRVTSKNFIFMNVSWDSPSFPNGIIQHYYLSWSSVSTELQLPPSFASTNITIPNLRGDTQYTIRLQVENGAGRNTIISINERTLAGVAPFGAPTLVADPNHRDRLNVRVGNFSTLFGPLLYYKLVVVTTDSTGPFPEETLYGYNDNRWRDVGYYGTAFFYSHNQSTTLVVGDGITYNFNSQEYYYNSPLQSGTTYRVFIRLFSGASNPAQPYTDSGLSNAIEVTSPVNLVVILVPLFFVIFLIVIIVIVIIVICVLLNKKHPTNKTETYYLDEIKAEAMKSSANNGNNNVVQRLGSNASASKMVGGEGAASGLYSPTITVSTSEVFTSAGQPTVLIIETGGTPSPDIHWSKEGMILEEPHYVKLNDGSLYITNTRLRDQGHFVVRASNSVSVVEEVVRVVVLAPSPPDSDPAHPPTSVSDYIERMALIHSSNSEVLEDEYHEVELEWNFTTYAAKLPVNHSKNRYVNIIPYDHSRVTLAHDGTPGSDYINGSYIDGLNSPNAYIATQGPIPATFADFWRMVWEVNAPTIVMVTNLKEDEKIKCHQYWPSYGTANYGNFQVTLKEVESIADYAIRTFLIQPLQGSSQIKEIRQYHFLVWPDHGVPQYATPLLSFQKRIRNYHRNKNGPMVVHCSAGVGRTGTFITLDTMIMKIDSEGMIDIFNFVRSMRFCRNYMVQTASQYEFLHDAILEAIMCQDTMMPASQITKKLAALNEVNSSTGKTGLQTQFETLESSSPTDEDFDCSVSQLADNIAKCRIKIHLPSNDHRVVLSTANNQTDFICASYIDGYRQRSAFMATQGPMKNTAGDFWRMIWEMKSMTVVMLTKTIENGEEQSVQYWPINSEESEIFGTFQVTALPEERVLPEYSIKKFKLSPVNSDLEIRTITHFQYTNWSSDSCPKEATSIIDLIADVVRVQRKSGNGPITVHCSDGLGRTGTFCAMFTVLERLKAEQVVDVFSTVKTLRIQRPGLIQSLEQYEFIHKAALEFVNTFDNYDNFKY